MRTDVFVSGRDGYHTYRIPALVRAANGDLLAICEGRRDSERDDGKIDLVLKRSRDGGRTWPESRLIDAGPSGYSDLCAEGVLYECGEKDYRERIGYART